MTIRSRTAGVTAAGVLALFLSGPAHAQSNTQNAPAALELFQEGFALQAKGQYAEALDRFQRSAQLNPSVGTLINVGQCYEKLGKTASAWTAYTDAERVGNIQKDPRATQAHTKAATLQSSLARLSITVPQERPADLKVTRSGVVVDPAAFNTAVPVDPGTVTVEASAPGRKPWSVSVAVEKAQSVSVPVPDLEKLPERPPPPQPPPPPEPSNTQRTVGIALEIGGGAILVTGLVFGGIAMGSWSSVTKACPAAHCGSPKIAADNQAGADHAKTFSTLSTVGVIAGAVILGGGIALHLTAPSHQLTVAPSADRSALGLTLTFRE